MEFLTDDSRPDSFCLPDLTDMFVAYSTVPGYVSHAGGENGSVYLQVNSYSYKKKKKRVA